MLIGALTRHVDLLESELLAERFPVFRDAEQVIADPVVRNRGTIGGSLCQADAAEDLSAVCAAVKAKVTIRGSAGAPRRRHGRVPRRPVRDRGRRRRDAHRGPAAASGPAAAARTRRSSGAPATGRSRPPRRRVWLDGDTIADAGIALSAVGPVTVHLSRAEALLRGQTPSEDLFAQAARSPPRTARRSPTAAARSTTSATWPAFSPPAPCAVRRPARSTGRPEMQVTININGTDVTRDVEPRQLLVHFIRDTAGLTGTHWGCDTSNCGACVVLMDGKPVKSCTTLAVMCEGHEIRTVESLEVDGQLDPIQQGFHEMHALHCGFCTPGMLMTTRALLDANPAPDRPRDPHGDLRPICRCTGYKNIVAAVQWAAAHSKQEV